MEGFDLDRYLRASKRVDLSSVRWEQASDPPITEAEARCLAYMMDIETHTVIFLRDLLVTRAAEEPDVTAFLACWVYEELWHGEAFSRFLGEAGWVLAPDGDRVEADHAYPTRVTRNDRIRRALGSRGFGRLIGTLLGSAMVDDFVALHMTWGAANELSTLTSYERLIAKTRNEQLVNLLRAIIKDERRHFAFYRGQARMRLAGSRSAQRVTRWAMDHLWAIVGTGVRPQSETDFVVVSLFGDADGRAAAQQMDATIAELPGMAECEIFARAGRQAAARRHRITATAPGMWRATPTRDEARPVSGA